MKKRKPVRYPPVFDKLSIGKSTNVHDIDGHRLARAQVDARCLAARPDCIAYFDGSFDGELQFLYAVPGILNLRFQYLWTGQIGSCKILVFDQLVVANFVGDSQVTLGKPALYDRLEAIQICRHSHAGVPRVGCGDRHPNCHDAKSASRDVRCHRVHPFGQTLREDRRKRLYILVIRREKNVVPIADEAGWRQASESAAFADEMGLIEVA